MGDSEEPMIEVAGEVARVEGLACWIDDRFVGRFMFTNVGNFAPTEKVGLSEVFSLNELATFQEQLVLGCEKAEWLNQE